MIPIEPFKEPSHGNDWTPAFNAAVKAATPKGESVKLPSGWLTFFTKPQAIGTGVTIVGDSCITSAKLGTCMVVMYEEDTDEEGFLTWDGSDPRTYKGTGGGIRDLSIYRLGGPSGGTAIKLVCLNNTTFRAGWWNLTNVAVLAENTSSWDRVFLADGTKVGPEGIRYITINNFMASSSKNYNVELRDVVHFHWTHGQVQGGHTVDPHAHPTGILIKGQHSQDVFINDVGIYGTLQIDNCQSFIINSVIKWLKINKAKRGIINAVGCDECINLTTPADKVIVTYV